MTDFKIKTAVWLHHRPWKPGQEKALETAGFSDAQKKTAERKGQIVIVPAPGPPVRKRRAKPTEKPAKVVEAKKADEPLDV